MPPGLKYRKSSVKTPGLKRWWLSYLSRCTCLKKRQRRVWNKGEVCPGERYRKERDSIPGSRFWIAAATGSGTTGTGKEHLLSLAKAANRRESTGQKRRFANPLEQAQARGRGEDICPGQGISRVKLA